MIYRPDLRLLGKMLAVLGVVVAVMASHAYQWAYHTHDTAPLDAVNTLTGWLTLAVTVAWAAMDVFRLWRAYCYHLEDSREAVRALTEARDEVRKMRCKMNRLKEISDTDKHIRRALDKVNHEYLNPLIN